MKRLQRAGKRQRTAGWEPCFATILLQISFSNISLGLLTGRTSSLCDTPNDSGVWRHTWCLFGLPPPLQTKQPCSLARSTGPSLTARTDTGQKLASCQFSGSTRYLEEMYEERGQETYFENFHFIKFFFFIIFCNSDPPIAEMTSTTEAKQYHNVQLSELLWLVYFVDNVLDVFISWIHH